MSTPLRKRFGQHFLHDPSVIAKIIASIRPLQAEHMVEIGGGHGALTLPLSERVARLHVIEIDRDLAAELNHRTADAEHVTVHSADALSFDFEQLAQPGQRLRVVGNLPYNVSTPLLFHLLEYREVVSELHVMLQKEVVDRMTAAPGGKDYGRLTVMLAAWTEIERRFDIGPGAFSPPPRVRSTFVRVRLRRSPRFAIADAVQFGQLVARLFSMRRKTLRRSLKGSLDSSQIESLGIDPGARPETLEPSRFAELAGLLETS